MNQLKLSQQESFLTLHKAGWSNRAIARELDLNREAVGKYLRSQTAPTTEATAGSVTGRKSCCEAWEPQIAGGLEKGPTAQRIYQDLVTEYQFVGSYQSFIAMSKDVKVFKRSRTPLFP